MSGSAWITTARGDINYDGDKLDAATYHPDHRFKSTSVAYLVDQFNPSGTWESWPSTFAKNTVSDVTDANYALDEGHFFMECSNRGKCDRKTGECECFPGYTGVNCRRTVCPDDCSGHGRCQTVSQQAVSPIVYQLWDAHMSRSCVCDPGFDGPACADRACPVGDDPLTTNQRNEVQWVDIFTDDLKDNGRDGPFKGTIKFEYEDYWGAKWKTSAIEVRPAGMYEGSVDAAGMASAAAAALEALPNNALRNVKVTVGHCDEVIAGDVSLETAANYFGNAGEFARCPEIDAGVAGSGVLLNDEGATFSDSAGWYSVAGLSAFDNGYKAYTHLSAYKVTMAAAYAGTCNKITHAYCTRFKIEFLSTPGDLKQITADTSDIEVKNQDSSKWENTVQGAISVQSSTVDELRISANVGAKFNYAGDATKIECAGADACEITTTTGVTTITVPIAKDGTQFNTNERIRIVCGTKPLGSYTVHATTHPTATEIVTQEIVPPCAGNVGTEVKVYLETKFVWTNTDFRVRKATCVEKAPVSLSVAGDKSACAAIQGSLLNDKVPCEAVMTIADSTAAACDYSDLTSTGSSSQVLSVGDYFEYVKDATPATCTETAVPSVLADKNACEATTDPVVCEALKTAADVTVSACTYTSGVPELKSGVIGPILARPGGDFSNPTAAVYWQPDNVAHSDGYHGRIFVQNTPNDGTTLTRTGGYFVAVGKGTTEASECSDRGTCDSDSGTCKCFGGYTGTACEKQNALSA